MERRGFRDYVRSSILKKDSPEGLVIVCREIRIRSGTELRGDWKNIDGFHADLVSGRSEEALGHGGFSAFDSEMVSSGVVINGVH